MTRKSVAPLFGMLDPGCMSDLMHTHLTFGFVDGCPACTQVTQDLAAGAPVGSMILA